MKKTLIVGLAAVLFVTALGAAPLQVDNSKCKDHPLFTRMPAYWIHHCDEREFNAYDFVVAMTKGKPSTEHVEGHFWKLSYYPQATATQKPSELQIIRNYENAVRKIGGIVVWSDKNRATFKIVKDGNETWVDLWAEFTGKYALTIVQREAMKQDVSASAEVFRNDIRSTGHAAVYGITFDTDSASIRPESEQALGEIAKLLQGDPSLKLFVVGHTDNAGSVDHNLKLSQDRAQAVVQALVSGHGIAASRLRAYGCGPYAPVASNDNEEGRAKNRRVELVKQ